MVGLDCDGAAVGASSAPFSRARARGGRRGGEAYRGGCHIPRPSIRTRATALAPPAIRPMLRRCPRIGGSSWAAVSGGSRHLSDFTLSLDRLGRKEAHLLCQRCDQRGHAAADCHNEASGACHQCGKPGHWARECATQLQGECQQCGEPGHGARGCTKELSMSGACHLCGVVGHRALECSQPSQGRPCHNCGQTGHMARECTAGHAHADVFYLRAPSQRAQARA